MTDASLPVKAINAHDYSRAALSASHISSLHHQRPYAAESTQEDDGQISCICGYADDDGYTVACDLCNRWQHQLCYYPQYDDGGLPQDLQHYCIDCKFRPIDKDRARIRQKEHREKREHAETITNGVKRAVSKSHKKKIKEPGAQTNGWPAVDKIRHDRNSASPRDIAPPAAKRPKTSHRTSDSITTTTATVATTTTVPTAKGHSRKRNASTAHNRRSSSRPPPDTSVDQYSAEFLRCYKNDEWDYAAANLHNSISVTNALSEWVDLPEDEFRAIHGQAKGDLLNRWDGNLEDIPGRACVAVETRQDDEVRYGGHHPTWKVLTVEESVPSGAYIGELKGRIDFKKEYQEESKNRWSRLRHPEPFVFFHPSLPIVIDAREEGTDLRYVRRSCRPNARLQILVTDHVDYHFCFMATQQIDPGMEISMGWDTNDGLPELTNRNNILEGDMELLSDWVSTALANCGPCACAGQAEDDCMMSRFDRRVRSHQDETQPAKPLKTKKRKATNQVSPLNTNTVNSRSGSEARKVEPDDEGTDSRSVSGSAGRGSASRDITPNTHYSTNGGQPAIPEMSERERKKMAKEEEIFRRQEEERNGKRGKIKRTSAGSNLNTPSATTSKQLGFPPTATSKYVDSGTSKQVGMPATKGGPGRKPKVQRNSARPASKVVNRPKLVYVDGSTQCDLDAEEASRRAALRPPRTTPRRYISNRQRLLDRCARNNARSKSKRNPSLSIETGAADPHDDKMDVEVSGISPSASSSKSVFKTLADTSPGQRHLPTSDLVMEDAPSQSVEKLESPVDAPVASPSPRELSAAPDGSKQASPVDNHVTAHIPNASSSDVDTSEAPPGSAMLHIDMPPPNANILSNAAGSTAQSPAALGTTAPVFSPAVTAAVSPSPARKKLSLSDYTRRSKAKDKDPDCKADRESSPASVASGPILQPSSSTEAAAAEGGSAIDEDVKMEDAEIGPRHA